MISTFSSQGRRPRICIDASWDVFAASPPVLTIFSHEECLLTVDGLDVSLRFKIQQFELVSKMFPVRQITHRCVPRASHLFVLVLPPHRSRVARSPRLYLMQKALLRFLAPIPSYRGPLRPCPHVYFLIIGLQPKKKMVSNIGLPSFSLSFRFGCPSPGSIMRRRGSPSPYLSHLRCFRPITGQVSNRSCQRFLQDFFNIFLTLPLNLDCPLSLVREFSLCLDIAIEGAPRIQEGFFSNRPPQALLCLLIA